MQTIRFSPLDVLPDAPIVALGPISAAFLERGTPSVHSAAAFVQRLPYGGNSRAGDSLALFDDSQGTCTTKHGVIARLAEELGLPITRCEGFYPLTDKIVTGVEEILGEYGLTYLPRAHCFLVYRDHYIDLTEGNCTGKNGLIESYFRIYDVVAEQTPEEYDALYRQFYAEACETEPAFARLGVDGMLEVRKRCGAVNAAACQRQARERELLV